MNKISIQHLEANLEDKGLTNVEITNERFTKINDAEINDNYDLVVFSHFLGQIEDIEILLKRMENAAKKRCVVIQPCGRDEIVKALFEVVTGKEYTGQFEPDAEYFAYVLLREWGRLVSVSYFDDSYERSLEEETRYVAAFVGRFIEVDAVVRERIADYLLSKLEGNRHTEKNQAILMMWEPE